jgi:hypothetical protein
MGLCRTETISKNACTALWIPLERRCGRFFGLPGENVTRRISYQISPFPYQIDQLPIKTLIVSSSAGGKHEPFFRSDFWSLFLAQW